MLTLRKEAEVRELEEAIEEERQAAENIIDSMVTALNLLSLAQTHLTYCLYHNHHYQEPITDM